ncbi:Dedicator of cytokinesis protein 7 [Lamellibrachia satsuma]|nr:Dedicator of cytokinesis protein 7 [Lamellibrachia satsuma]
MASGQRAFAQKLNKRGAAEVRKQVSSSYLADLPKSISGLNLSTAGQSIPQGGVEPPDFEEFLYQHQNAIDRDPMRHLLEFPPDDVRVELLQRTVRTVSPVMPEQGAESDPHIRDCIKCYTSGFTEVNRCYQQLACQHWDDAGRSGTLRPTLKQEYEVDVEEDEVEETNKTEDTEKEVEPERTSIHLSDTPRGSWASSIFDLKNSQADPLLPHLLERLPADQVDEVNDAERRQNRQDAIFCLYPPQPDEEMLEKRAPAQMPAPHIAHRILVKCLELRLELDIEPIFASMALYDAKERKKISENFYFDMTPEHTKQMLSRHVPYQEISTLSRSCIFDITYPSPDIYLVIKLEKVLQQGDISDVTEPYLTKDDKKEEKARQNAANFCERLGKYRMPFAWTAIYLKNIVEGGNPLDTDKEKSDSLDRRSNVLSQYERVWKKAVKEDSFVRHGSLERTRSNSSDKRDQNMDEYATNLDNFRPITLSMSSFYKQETDRLSDDDLYKFLTDLKKPSAGVLRKQQKMLPGSLKLDISPCPSELNYCLTPELSRLYPYPDDKNRPIKEILEFPSREVYEPYDTYRNLLYVYPRLLNFTNRQGSARNIAVKIQLMNGEDQRPLRVMFGKSSCPEFCDESYAPVTYHNKNPYFYEEVKQQLPARLSDDHHLLFTFYHISCQKKELTPTETPIGYTWLPLLRDGRLTVGDFNLPVSVEQLPSHYSMLHPDVQPQGIKWVDNHKGLFNVSIQAVSSVHTLDSRLDRFLGLVNAAEEHKIPPRVGEVNFERELKHSLSELIYVDERPLIRFLPLLLDKLLHLLVRPPVIAGQVVNIGQASFEAIAQIVRRAQGIVIHKNDRHGRNCLLTTYIQYTCTLPYMDTGQRGGMSYPVGYSTLANRPVSLPVSSQSHHRCSSDPDLPSSPSTPDSEVASLTGGRTMDRTGSLRKQDHQHRVHAKKLVHEELALQWVVSSGSTKELALTNSWFFFELIIKSMAVHLARMGKLNGHRKARFPDQFVDDIVALHSTITKDIVDRYIRDPLLIRSLNTGLAFFLYDCLSLMDRGFVFRLVQYYCRCVSAKVATLQDATTLISLKLDLLRIVCSHEHYITLNLPFGTPLTPSAPSSPCPSIASSTSQTSYASTSTLTDRGLFTELSSDYCAQHYLAGLVLSELANVCELPSANLHHSMINIMRNLLCSHDTDPRYRDPEVKARVACLYLPLIGVVMDALPQLHATGVDMQQRSMPQDDRIDKRVALSISCSSVYSPASEAVTRGGEPPGRPGSRKGQLSEEATRNLMACFLWVVKNVDQHILHTWWSDMSINRLNQIIDVLYFCVSIFEYKPYLSVWKTKCGLEWWETDCSATDHCEVQLSDHDTSSPVPGSQGKKAIRQYSLQTIKKSVDMKSKLEDAILGTVSARSEMMMRHKQLSAERAPPSPTSEAANARLRWRKDLTQWKRASEHFDSSHNSSKVMPESEVDTYIEGSLAAEATMIVIDTLELIVQIAQTSDMLQGILGSVLRVLLHSLALNQSTCVLQHMFALQRSLVSKFPELLFEEETEQCADLCLRLLRHCSSPIGSTRMHASASLYLLMRQNFEIGNNFARVKMQVTMSLSSLVGQNQNFNEEHLRRSLKTILTYAEADVELHGTTFPEQVRDLVFNLHMILSDTVKMKEFQEDPEMLMDLMYRIAKGYQNSPDLRLTWLQTMAGKHSERDRHAEAAQCLVHSAALVAEYLNMLEDKPYLPRGCVSFQHISSNVLVESAVSDDVVSPEEEGICTGKYFSEGGLLGLLEQAAGSFQMAQMFEAVNDVYKVVIPIHEANRDYKKLSAIHGKLQDAFNNVMRQEGKRMFGTYFRVGFYGTKFGDLDGEEFIYKEPAITKLPEISNRLESFYSERFGEEWVVILKDSNTVDRDKLNPEKAYIQITYVEPYFDTYELRDRVTYFDKNYAIKRFIYATPFTVDGRAHGDLQDQYKRKTILTTTRAFPYVKTRLQVVRREQVVLVPIEVAIEDIRKKTRELALALHQEPPDAKMLQMVLQGCIGTTVNQGPVEIAMVFLAPLADGKNTPSKHHNKLRISFKDFLKKCSDALHRNRSLISADQKEYQHELERNYHRIKEKLHPMISSSVAQSLNGTTKKKHKRDKGDHSRRLNYHPSDSFV